MEPIYEYSARSVLRGAGLVRDETEPATGPSRKAATLRNAAASLCAPGRLDLDQSLSRADSPAGVAADVAAAVDVEADVAVGVPAGALAARLLLAPLQIQRTQAALALEEARLLYWLRECPARDSLGFVSFSDIVRELLYTPPRTAQEHIAVYRACEAAPRLRRAFLEGELSFCRLLVLEPLVRRHSRDVGLGRMNDPRSDDRVSRVNDPAVDGGPGGESWDASLLTWLRSLGPVSVAELRRLVRERLSAEPRSSAKAGGTPGADAFAADAREADATEADFKEAPGSTAELAAVVETAGDDDFRTVSFDAPPVVAVVWENGLEFARRVLGYNAPRYACIEAILIEAAAPALGQIRPLPERRSGGTKQPEEMSSGVSAASVASIASIASMAVGSPRATSRNPFDPLDPLDLRRQQARERAGETLTLVRVHLDQLTELLTGGEPEGPWDAVLRIRRIQALSRPGRVLLARLLRDLRDTHVFEGLRRTGIEDYCQRELKLSERTARALRSEAELFEDYPELASAFEEGRLGITQAMRIGRLSGVPVNARLSNAPLSNARLSHGNPRPVLDRFILRASQVTRREFDRECRFLERVRAFLPHLRVSHYGPLCGRRIETDLLRELAEYGWPEAKVEVHLENHGLGVAECMGPVLWRKGRPHVSRDPAHNPLTLRRMETILNLLVTVRFEVETENPTSVSVLQNEENRRTLARPTSDAESNNPSISGERSEADRAPADRPDDDPVSVDPPSDTDRVSCDRSDTARPDRAQEPAEDRQPLARAEWPPQPGSVRIRFSAPLPIIQHWLAAIGWVEEQCLPLDKNRAPIPTWAAVALLLDGAISEWTRTDPERIPTEWKVLERDEYCCGTPGCTRRHTLESHHVELKSHGGSDRLYNRRAACHGHHRLFHLGYIRVTGKAPGALHWEIGRNGPSPDSEPIWRLLGERFEDEKVKAKVKVNKNKNKNKKQGIAGRSRVR